MLLAFSYQDEMAAGRPQSWEVLQGRLMKGGSCLGTHFRVAGGTPILGACCCRDRFRRRPFPNPSNLESLAMELAEAEPVPWTFSLSAPQPERVDQRLEQLFKTHLD